MSLQELTVERYEGVADDQRILLLKGPITIETTPQFERAVRSESADTVILDFSDVPYIDSVGLGSLVAAYVSHQKTGRCLVLTGVKPRVTKILEITKVKDFFVTFPTTWQAVETMANTGRA
ncbi:MAG: STAS domain-containing protein [Terriglobales bacterium]